MGAAVMDNPGQHRFEMAIAPDAIAAAHYRVDGSRLVLIHTGGSFRTSIDDRSLLPDEGARIASRRFEDWLRQTLQSVTYAPLRWRIRG